MIAKNSKKGKRESELLTLMDIEKSTLVNEFFVNLLVNGKTSPKKI